MGAMCETTEIINGALPCAMRHTAETGGMNPLTVLPTPLGSNVSCRIYLVALRCNNRWLFVRSLIHIAVASADHKNIVWFEFWVLVGNCALLCLPMGLYLLGAHHSSPISRNTLHSLTPSD